MVSLTRLLRNAAPSAARHAQMTAASTISHTVSPGERPLSLRGYLYMSSQTADLWPSLAFDNPDSTSAAGTSAQGLPLHRDPLRNQGASRSSSLASCFVPRPTAARPPLSGLVGPPSSDKLTLISDSTSLLRFSTRSRILDLQPSLPPTQRSPARVRSPFHMFSRLSQNSGIKQTDSYRFQPLASNFLLVRRRRSSSRRHEP